MITIQNKRIKTRMLVSCCGIVVLISFIALDRKRKFVTIPFPTNCPFPKINITLGER
ncbi:MAG: hypothetical protein LBT09_09480 [Planctomycetaceae bacterium]|nr:hypothetical protein [Planctomycetaceae bacterium]